MAYESTRKEYVGLAEKFSVAVKAFFGPVVDWQVFGSLTCDADIHCGDKNALPKVVDRRSG